MTVEETGILLWNPLGGEAGKMDMSLPDDRSKMAVEPSSCSTTRNISQSSQRISINNEDKPKIMLREDDEKVGPWQEHGLCKISVTTLDNNSTRETHRTFDGTGLCSASSSCGGRRRRSRRRRRRRLPSKIQGRGEIIMIHKERRRI